MRKIMMTSALLCACVSCGNVATNDTSDGSAAGFPFSFFKSVLETSPDDTDVTVSPYSASAALSMLAEGAGGQTLEELDNVLGGQRTKSLKGEGKIVLKTANSLWSNKLYPVKKEYSKLLSKEYGSKVETLDFSTPSSKDVINDWAAEHTGGLIDNVVDELTTDMVAVLANALYFKAPWENPFSADDTEKLPFYGAKKESKVPYMYSEGKYEYTEYHGSQMIRIPYAGGRYVMTVILPSEKLGTKALQEYLNAKYFDLALGELVKTKVKLHLPKFRIETGMSLMPVLQKMGVVSAFSGNADLSGIADGPLTVSQVNQKCYVNVDEEGSEAAAVTTVGIRLTSVRPELDVPSMWVNRPFYYMISDVQSSDILFIGRISNL